MIYCTYWQDQNMFIGHLNEYPDYQTQGESVDELMEHLKDIYKDINKGLIKNVKKVVALEI